jgi:hypothetical protein
VSDRRGTISIGIVASVAATLAFALPAPALAQELPAGVDASVVLEQAESALAPAPQVEPDREATLALNQLAAAVPALQGRERRKARSLLARPTDGSADRYGDGYPAAAPVASAESAHFCVFWVNAPGFPDSPNLADLNGVADGDGIPDYVEEMLLIAEHSYSVEVAPGPLGWRPPKPDKDGCGADPSARADIYLKQLGTKGLFGYESPDPGQGRARKQYGYMVLDNDYAQAEYGYADPLIPAKVTFAHEFNHLLQQNYDSFQDLWMFESTATWVEDHVYPEINDYLNYLPSFAQNPGKPLTLRTAGRQLKVYGAAVWNHWLATGGGGYGVGVVPASWGASAATKPKDLAVAAYDKGIRDAGGRGFSRELVKFTAATAEWQSGFGGFPDAAAYPDMKRAGKLKPGGRASFTLDHTAYRLLDIEPGAGKLKLKVSTEKGVRSGLSLVARFGDALSGTVVSKTKYLGNGRRGSVKLKGLEGATRITAVVVNADGRVKGFRKDDWAYAKENVRFKARLAR